MDENISEESSTDSDGKGRTRRKSPKNSLYDSLKQIDALLAKPTLKEAKQADLVIEKVAIQKLLLQMENDEAIELVKTLKSQVAQHELIIAELQAVNADLSQRVSERVTEIVPDHEAREENEKLRATQKETLGLLKFLTSSLGGNPDGKARLAVRVIQNFPASAQEFLPLIGCDYSTFMRGIRMSDQELLDVLEKSQNPNGEMCIVARACLAAVAPKVAPKKETAYIPDTRPLDVKMAEADAAAKKLRGPAGFKSAILNITANPAPPSEPPATEQSQWHAETFESLPRRSYLNYNGSGDLDL
jgi:hypothetical protein